MSETDEPVDVPPEAPPAEADEPRTDVSRALDSLADLDTTPPEQHPDVYQRIHTTLHDALAAIDGS
jgi:hypothetical protein